MYTYTKSTKKYRRREKKIGFMESKRRRRRHRSGGKFFPFAHPRPVKLPLLFYFYFIFLQPFFCPRRLSPRSVVVWGSSRLMNLMWRDNVGKGYIQAHTTPSYNIRKKRDVSPRPLYIYTHSSNIQHEFFH